MIQALRWLSKYIHLYVGTVELLLLLFIRNSLEDFPRSPVVKILPYKCSGCSLIPGQGANISHASQPKDNMNKK